MVSYYADKTKGSKSVFGSAAFLYISFVTSADRADAVRAVGRADVQLGLLVLVAAEQRRVEGAHRRLAALVLRLVNLLANSGQFQTIRIGKMIRISRKSFKERLKMEEPEKDNK